MEHLIYFIIFISGFIFAAILSKIISRIEKSKNNAKEFRDMLQKNK